MKDTVFSMVPLGDLIPTPENNRRKPLPTDRDIKELAKSIKNLGQHTPGIARPHPKKKGKYDLRAGARRYCASVLAGKKHMPILIKENMTDQEALETTITENMQREDLTPIEEARGIDMLHTKGWDTKTIAAHIGKSEKWVQRRARLINISPKWIKLCENRLSQWSVSHMEIISRLEPAAQNEFLKKGRFWDSDSVRELESKVSEYTKVIGKAIFDTGMNSCEDCQKRSGYYPGLFDNNGDKKDIKRQRCLDKTCWDKRTKFKIKLIEGNLRENHPDVVLVTHETWDRCRLTDEERDRGVLPKREFNSSIKKNKKAVPAMDVNTGGVTWVTLKTKENGSGQRAPGTPTPLKDRRDKVNRRRNFWIITNIIESLEGKKKALQTVALPSHREMVMIAVTWGVKGYGAGDWYKTPTWGRYDKFIAMTPAKQEKELWATVGKTLIENINCSYDPRVKQAKKVCSLCGLTWNDFSKAAKKEIPNPKIWATLNEDGTPKKKPGKNKGKK